jgi:hypothetical protein
MCINSAVFTDGLSQVQEPGRNRTCHPAQRNLCKSMRLLAHLSLQTRALFPTKCQIQQSILIGKGRLSLPLKTSFLKNGQIQ